MTTKTTNPSVLRQRFGAIALLCTAVILFLASCGKDDPVPDPTLSVSPSEAIVFSAAATESYEITVATNQVSWDAMSNQSWCIVTKAAGKFTVTATPNINGTAPAPAMITVTAPGAANVTIAVTQLPAGPTLSVSPSEAISFSAAATESHEITVTTNQASWDAVSDQPWCIVTKGSGNFIVSATPNTKGTAPTPATITVTAPGAANVTIAVTQLPIVTIDKVLIPSGSFTMGSPASEPNRQTNEIQHGVILTKDFYMSKYAVTNAQYAAFLNANAIGSDRKWAAGPDPNQVLITATSGVYDWGLHWNDKWIPVSGKENFPVINVTWYGATAFAGWVGGALPTEAQWEYACRGGLGDKPFGVGDGTKLYADQANFKGTHPYDLANDGERANYTGPTPPATNLEKTSAVGSYAPNAFGLYDMHGNVWEWCSDWYGNYSATAVSDPTGPDSGTNRVMRGGSWYSAAQLSRSAYRRTFKPDGTSVDFGFRVVFLP